MYRSRHAKLRIESVKPIVFPRRELACKPCSSVRSVGSSRFDAFNGVLPRVSLLGRSAHCAPRYVRTARLYGVVNARRKYRCTRTLRGQRLRSDSEVGSAVTSRRLKGTWIGSHAECGVKGAPAAFVKIFEVFFFFDFVEKIPTRWVFISFRWVICKGTTFLDLLFSSNVPFTGRKRAINRFFNYPPSVIPPPPRV